MCTSEVYSNYVLHMYANLSTLIYMYANLSTLIILILWAQCLFIRCGNKMVVIFCFVDEKEMFEQKGPLDRNERKLTYFS